ncbi:RNA polymerase sigma factor [Paenibacillus sp. BT-177]|uniref:RNA polymerase sigma factor n=1 Tax=Paenibacillus sp. BT-177 TaxID=2986930 RepID=UPI0021F7FF91|nr:RNA polymerase sigma factor [Paenibacillus sp. BT-177]
MEDKELAESACQGDEDAFFTLITRHNRRLYGIAYSYLRNEADALDMLQEATYRAWSQCSKLRDPAALIPWIIRILMNCCMEELKRQKRRRSQIPVLVTEGVAEMVSDSKLDMQQALSRLKPKYRQALLLRYYDDMTVPEIAKILGRSEGTIKTWLHQGLKQLRHKIHHGGEIQHG